MNNLNKTFYFLRTLSFLSQKEIAEKMNVSNSYYCEVETGKKDCSIDFLYKFSSAIDVKPSQVMALAENIYKWDFIDLVIRSV